MLYMHEYIYIYMRARGSLWSPIIKVPAIVLMILFSLNSVYFKSALEYNKKLE